MVAADPIVVAERAQSEERGLSCPSWERSVHHMDKFGVPSQLSLCFSKSNGHRTRPAQGGKGDVAYFS